MEDYIGKHEQNVSVFDAIHAEILGEKELRREKFMRTHGVDKFGNPVKKDKTNKDRKRNKLRRISKMYGFCFEDGKEWYWVCGAMGRKQNTELDAEIVTNLKIAERDRSLREDYEDEQRQAYWDEIGYVPERVGKTTLTKVMNRTYRRMQKIANDFCEKNGYQWGELYAYDPKNHYYHVDYPDEYYRVRSEYMALREECDERFIRKMQKGEC